MKNKIVCAWPALAVIAAACILTYAIVRIINVPQIPTDDEPDELEDCIII